MPGFTITTRFAAPADRVFATLTDLEAAERRIPEIVRIEVLTDAPFGSGTRWRETRRVLRREATEEMEVVDFQPGAAYTVGCESCGCEYRFTYRLRPRGDATDVDIDVQYKPVSFLARVMWPAGRLMQGTMKKCVEKDLDRLRAAAEGADAAAAAPA